MNQDIGFVRQTAIAEKREAPLWVLLPISIVLTFNIVQLFVGAWQSSPTSDSSTYVLWLQNLLTNGAYSFPDSGTHEGHGPISALLQHASAVLLGVETWSQTQWTPEANAARHLAIAGMSVAGLVAAGICTWLLTNSWRWAVISAAVLSAIPAWTGHGMFNTTDVPAATGYTAFTAAAILMTRPTHWSSGRALGAFSLSLVGWILAFGSRPGVWPALMLTLALVGAAAALRAPSVSLSLGRTRALLRSTAPILGGSVVGYAFLWAIDPRGHGDVLSTLRVAITSSSQFPYTGSVLVNGRVDSMPPRRTYILEWISHQMPLLILAAGLLFAVFWLYMTWRSISSEERRGVASKDTTFLIGSFLVLVQVTLLPTLGVLLGSTFYNGTRQLLFVLPAFAVLAALGFSGFQTWSVRKFKALGTAASALVIFLAVAAPSFAQFRLFPYNYLYFNVLAESRGVDNNWSADYWRASTRELIRRTPAGVPRDCDPWSGSSLDQCADYPDYVLYAEEAGEDAGPSGLEADQYYLMRYTEFGTALPDSCNQVDAIRRPLAFRSVTVAVIGICDFPLREPIGNDVDFSVTTQDGAARLVHGNDAALLWGWQTDPLLGVWANWETAGIGVRLDDSLRGRALELELFGHLQTEDLVPRELRVKVNGQDVGSASFDKENRNSTRSFLVPIEIANSLNGDFVVELSDPTRPKGPLVYLLGAMKLSAQSGFGNKPS